MFANQPFERRERRFSCAASGQGRACALREAVRCASRHASQGGASLPLHRAWVPTRAPSFQPADVRHAKAKAKAPTGKHCSCSGARFAMRKRQIARPWCTFSLPPRPSRAQPAVQCSSAAAQRREGALGGRRGARVWMKAPRARRAALGERCTRLAHLPHPFFPRQNHDAAAYACDHDVAQSLDDPKIA